MAPCLARQWPGFRDSAPVVTCTYRHTPSIRLKLCKAWRSRASMINRENCCALLLAAGDGRRLTSLTTTRKGITVPKQFCAFSGGASLLQQALQRGAAATCWERICAVVAWDHRNWWTEQLESLAADDIFVQPRNRGTGNGILFPLLNILERGPGARLLLLPSDHCLRDEGTLAQSVSAAASACALRPAVEPVQSLEHLGEGESAHYHLTWGQKNEEELDEGGVAGAR